MNNGYFVRAFGRDYKALTFAKNGVYQVEIEGQLYFGSLNHLHGVAAQLTENHRQRCIQNIQNFQKLIDQVLPQAGKLVIDIGLLNDTLVEASALLREGGEA